MYRNFGANRSRFAQNRTSDYYHDRDHNRRNWRDNRPRNDESDSDSEYRKLNNFRNIDNNTETRENSSFTNSTNSSNRRFNDIQGEENQFSTPINNFNTHDNISSPIHQQLQSILGQPIIQSTIPVQNSQIRQNHVFQQPNVPITPPNNNSSAVNQRINFSPAVNTDINSQGARKSGISLTQSARVPTFSPVSSPIVSMQNTVPSYHSNSNPNQYPVSHNVPVDNFLHSIPGFSAQSMSTIPSYGGQMQATGVFTEYHKAMLQSLLHLDKQLLDQINDIRNISKKDYPMFPKCDKNGMVTAAEYRAWRRAFLVQLQGDERINNVLVPTYAPPHTLVAVPQPTDQIFGGFDILYRHAIRVLSSMEKMHEAMIDKLAIILIHVLQQCGLAQQFMDQDTIDPIKVIGELDTLYIQQTKYTRADHIMKFWSLEIEKGEMFSVFLARLENARAELRDRFNVFISDEEFQTVMQSNISNLGPEMFSVYEHFS